MDSCSAVSTSAPRTRELRPWIITLTTTAGLLLAVGIFPSHSSAAGICFGLGFLIGLLVPRSNHRSASSNRVAPEWVVPASLTRHPELQVFLISLRHSLTKLAKQSDEILRDAAILKLTQAQEDVAMLANGKVLYAGTEGWRAAYERVLRSPGISRYLSVAWLRDDEYWQDPAGRHSMQLNYDLVQLGVRIERILILNDFFWPPAAVLPAKTICRWIDDQHKRGIVVRLVRESEIEAERDLLCDFGIYGGRATGCLEMDDCRTVRFTLDFDPRSVQLFEERWSRLLLFTVSFREILDRAGAAGGRCPPEVGIDDRRL